MRENMGAYRGKRLDNGEWVTGFFCEFWINGNKEISYQIFVRDEGVPTGRIFFDRGAWHIVDPATVGEYVAKEKFYEGDVLLGKEFDEFGTLMSSWFGVVKYDDSTGRIRIKDDLGDWYETDDFDYDEVFSNIYDHPEFLR